MKPLLSLALSLIVLPLVVAISLPVNALAAPDTDEPVGVTGGVHVYCEVSIRIRDETGDGLSHSIILRLVDIAGGTGYRIELTRDHFAYGFALKRNVTGNTTYMVYFEFSDYYGELNVLDRASRVPVVSFHATSSGYFADWIIVRAGDEGFEVLADDGVDYTLIDDDAALEALLSQLDLSDVGFGGAEMIVPLPPIPLPQITASEQERSAGIWDDLINSLREHWLSFLLLLIGLVLLGGAVLYRRRFAIRDDDL